jgi:O-antigen/teichoic acid export membrane protein
LATSRVVQSTTTATANIGMGFSGFGSSGLILGGVLGQGVATAILGRMVWREDRDRLESVKKLKMFALVKRYIKFPKYNLLNAVIDGFRLSGINILIGAFYTTSILGQFSLAWKIIQMPMGLIGSSLSQVFFQKVATTNKNNLSFWVKKYLIRAFLVAFPIFLIIYIYAVDIFSIVFGKNWEVAGEVASILTPWLFLNFLTSPLSMLFIKLNRQEILLSFSVFYMVVPLLLIFIFKHLEFLKLIKIITLSMSIMLLIFIFILFFVLKKESK